MTVSINSLLPDHPACHASCEKTRTVRKNFRKSTYPPPADGLCVPFLCNVGCSANKPVAQAGRGALQAIGNFTDCKVLKRNAARLQSSASGGRERLATEPPGFIVRKILKRPKAAVFENVSGLFQAAIIYERRNVNSPTALIFRGL